MYSNLLGRFVPTVSLHLMTQSVYLKIISSISVTISSGYVKRTLLSQQVMLLHITPFLSLDVQVIIDEASHVILASSSKINTDQLAM
jgi:hypothetical protein